MKTELPLELVPKMRAWSMGQLDSIPQGYIDFHRDLALARLEAKASSEFTVLSTELKCGGWHNGMLVIHAEVEVDGETQTLKWNTTNQDFVMKLAEWQWAKPGVK